MGARGPAPTPSAIKKARGTFRPDRSAAREAEPDLFSKVPPPPDWLNLKTEQREWQRTAAVLVDAGLLTLADLDTLALYVRTKIAYIKASRKARLNPTSKFKTGAEQVSPWVTMERAYAEKLIKLSSLLGMNPSSRTRIEAAPKPPDRGDNLIQ